MEVPPRVQDERIVGVGRLGARAVIDRPELRSLADRKPGHVKDRRPGVAFVGTGPLEAGPLQPGVTHSPHGGPELAHLVPDPVGPGITEFIAVTHASGEKAEDLPIRLGLAPGPDRPPDPLDTALGVHEGPVLLEGAASREKYSPELPRGLVEEKVDH